MYSTAICKFALPDPTFARALLASVAGSVSRSVVAITVCVLELKEARSITVSINAMQLTGNVTTWNRERTINEAGRPF